MAKRKSEITIKYKGSGDEAQVMDLGVFAKGNPVTLKGEKVQAAEKLLATNIKFEEVEK